MNLKFSLGIKDKKTLKAVVCLCLAFVLVFGGIIAAVVLLLGKDEAPEATENRINLDIAGVWIASISNIDFPSEPDLDKNTLKAELDSIVDTVEAAGLNTIFFQVRPASDALYDSEIFPVSKYLSTDGELTLDCLEYIIKAAHKKDISVHAWVNPLRVSTSNSELPKGHPAERDKSLTVKYTDGVTYYDCGNPDVIKLICDGVAEIVEGYDVDGIVFDDYFYPYPKYITAEDGSKALAVFNDENTFDEYGDEFDSLEDWRRDNVNRMVKSVYDTVKEVNEECLFGISPFGIWKNGYGDISGSETRGSQSYHDIFCDTLAWVEGGYVDYIAPQLYWTDQTSAAPYNVLCSWWDRMVCEKSKSVSLLISHGAYNYDGTWENAEGIMKHQVELAKECESYSGSVFYGYDEIKNNANGIFEEIKEIYTVK